MISEFHQLSEKISSLAALTQSLRKENADSRLHIAALTEENARLSARMEEASARIAALLDTLPSPIVEEETA